MKKTTRIIRRRKKEDEWNKIMQSIGIISGDPINQIKKSVRGVNNARR